MVAFEVFLNGKKLCLAGIGDDGVLTVTMTYAPYANRKELYAYVGGLVLPQDEHVRWKRPRLRLGDELRVKIVERETVDRPSKRFPRDRKTEAENEKRHVLKIA